MFKSYVIVTSCCLVANAQMTARFCVRNKYLLVSFCAARNISIADCFCNDQFPGDKSSGGKPGEKFENGIRNVNGESSIVNK